MVVLTAPYFAPRGDNTTDDTARLQALLDASAGGTCYIPPPAVMYRVTARLTVPSKTHIVMDRQTIIRQETAFEPVFDCLDTTGTPRTDITIEGGQLRYEGSRAYTLPGGSGRSDLRSEIGASIWTNCHNTVVRNVRGYGFYSVVRVSGWDGTTQTSYRTKDCLVENVYGDTVNFVVQATGFDRLTLKGIRGKVVQYTTGAQGSAPAARLIQAYGGALSVLNRGLQIGTAGCESSDGGHAYQISSNRGATVGQLYAYDAPGILSCTNAQDVTIGALVSEADKGNTSSLIPIDIDANSSRVEIGKAVITQVVGNTIVRMLGTDCRIDKLRLTGGFTGSNSASPTLSLGGTRNIVDGVGYSNTTAGILSRGVQISGTDCVARNLRFSDSEYVAYLLSTAVRPVIELDPSLTAVSGATAAGARTVRQDCPAANEPRVRPRATRVAYTVAAAGSLQLGAPDVTHASITANGNITLSNPYSMTPTNELTYEVLNNTAGAITVTWGADFEFNTAWVNPAPAARKSITFVYDGTKWREKSRSS